MKTALLLSTLLAGCATLGPPTGFIQEVHANIEKPSFASCQKDVHAYTIDVFLDTSSRNQFVYTDERCGMLGTQRAWCAMEVYVDALSTVADFREAQVLHERIDVIGPNVYRIHRKPLDKLTHDEREEYLKLLKELFD